MSDPSSREREVFLHALEQATPEAREACVDAACAGHPELRSTVEVAILGCQ